MDANTVEVAVTVTAGGQTITKSATGGTADNPFRLADRIINAVTAEVSNELSEPRMEWDGRRKQSPRRAGRGI